MGGFSADGREYTITVEAVTIAGTRLTAGTLEQRDS